MTKSNRDLFMSIGFLIVFTLIATAISLYLTQGHLTYAIHAPYIHWAMVKHLVHDGILSVDGFSYSSVSSSPLWLFILSFFYAILDSSAFVWISLILNILFQIITLVTIFKLVKKYTKENLHFLYGVMIIVITPFLAQTLGGLEHSLQIMLIVLFIYNFIGYLSDSDESSYKNYMLLLAPFIVAVRYEDLAFISAISLVITLFNKDIKYAIMLFLSSLILITLFGVWSDASFNLGYLPTSISAKSGESHTLLEKFIGNISYSHIIAIILLNIAVMVSSFKKSRTLFLLTITYLITFVVHLAFAKVGWLYRYEAYLITFGLINLLLYIKTFKIDRSKLLILVAFLLLSSYKQIFFSPVKSVLSSRAVYEQQIQEGELLKEFKDYYIATDNIGTIPYFADDKILDIHGLSNPKIIELKSKNQFNDKTKKEMIISEDVDMIVAYKARFKDEKIGDYVKIATWKIKNKVLNGDDEVVFYAKKDLVKEVKRKIENFSKTKLPKRVEVIWNKI
jgi:hypothetical protein